MKNKKQRKVFLYLLIILGISVGFALLSTTLNINGIAGIKSNTWNIHWDDTSIDVANGSVSATTPNVSTVTTPKDTVSFNVEFEMPGDYYEFTVDAINEGSIDGIITLSNKKIYDSNNQELTGSNIPSYLIYNVTYDDDNTPAVGDVLKVGNSEKYKIRVEFDSEATSLPSGAETYTFEYTVIYGQTKDGIIKHNVGDMVYFDPVNYEYCRYDQSSPTCYTWAVVSENKNETELFLLEDINSFQWTQTNPATIIESATSSWDNRLKNVNSKYDIDVTENLKIQFSDKKARMLLISEFDNLTNEAQTTIHEACGVYGGTVCGVLDTDTNYVKQIVSSGVSTTYPFSAMRNGAALGTGTTVRLVIKISDSEQKTRVSDDVYKAGDVVYFDPITTNKCDSTVFNYYDVRLGNSTCYRWRVIATDDTVKKTKIAIQLDHNLVNGMSYTGPGCNSYGYGPSIALNKLAEATEDWVRSPLLNYEYDLGIVPNTYTEKQKLVCTDGSCIVDRETSPDISYTFTGLRYRLITGEEFMNIVKTVNPAAVWSMDGSERSSDVFYFSPMNGSTKLKWLIENTREDATSGATNNKYNVSNYYYYWMLTPDYDYWVKGDWANYIYFSGYTDSTGACLDNYYSSWGLRPVTDINKSMITKK